MVHLLGVRSRAMKHTETRKCITVNIITDDTNTHTSTDCTKPLFNYKKNVKLILLNWYDGGWFVCLTGCHIIWIIFRMFISFGKAKTMVMMMKWEYCQFVMEKVHVIGIPSTKCECLSLHYTLWSTTTYTHTRITRLRTSPCDRTWIRASFIWTRSLSRAQPTGTGAPLRLILSLSGARCATHSAVLVRAARGNGIPVVWLDSCTRRRELYVILQQQLAS